MQAKLEFFKQTVLPVVQSQHWSLCNTSDGVVKDLVDIEQSLQNIWDTEIGSDPLRPDFGCAWTQYIDYPIDEAPLLITRELILAAQKWEPRVKVKRVVYMTENEHIFFRTYYQLSDEIAGDLKGIEYTASIRSSYVRDR